MRKGISCPELLACIPDDLVSDLAKEMGVNRQVKKLSGEILLKLILFSLLDNRQVSLRIMEEICASEQFRGASGKGVRKVKFNTIAERINIIDAVFFEKIFQSLLVRFKPLLKKTRGTSDLSIYDSTLVGISAKLFQEGMRSGGGERKHVKFTFGFDGTFPESVSIFREPRAISEEVALKKAILGQKAEKRSIVIFDRGLQSRMTFCEFSKNGISFITRLKTKVSYEEISIFKNISGRKTETLILKKDLLVRFKDAHGRPLEETFRLIVARSIATDEEMLFTTNITYLSAREITDLYRRRWDIEVFFKFLKQELNFKHLVSRSENGIRVMLWATLILALLLLVFKERNGIAGYKIAKVRFALELEAEIMKEIVSSCGGDPSLFFRSKNPSSP